MKHIGYIYTQNIPLLARGEAVDIRPKDEMDEIREENLKYYRAVYVNYDETPER